MKDEELQVLVELHDVLSDCMPAISDYSIAEARRNTTSPRKTLVWRQREQRARAAIFRVHAVDESGKVIIKRKLRRSELIPFFEKQAACIVVLEACGAGHHWACTLTAVGNDVKLIAPEAARPFIKKDKKSDAADAAALCGGLSQT